jgi:hypothetical protein
MKTFTAHVRRGRQLVLVKEAFSWGAFLFGPIWLLWQRAWSVAVLAVMAFALTLAAPPPLRPVLGFGLFLLLGFTGRDLVRWSLSRSGYQFAHVVAARNTDEAFVRLLDHDPAIAEAELAGRNAQKRVAA